MEKLTIDQAKKLKVECENKISVLLNEFYAETKLIPGKVDIITKTYKLHTSPEFIQISVDIKIEL